MEILDLIKRRVSIRRYKSDEVPEELLMKVLEAGRLAPSARNDQNWNFILVKNADKKDALYEACGCQESVKTAPAAIVLWTKDNTPMLCGVPRGTADCSIALSYMTLQAEELGLGMCWLGHFHADMVKDIFGLPEEGIPIAVTPIGWPDEKPAVKPRKSMDEVLKTV